jgi:mannose-1-phosphate guanylyltransferase
LANAGIYISNPEILEQIQEEDFADIGYNLLPKLVGNMCGWESHDYLRDIGTHEDLVAANTEWEKIIGGNTIGI